MAFVQAINANSSSSVSSLTSASIATTTGNAICIGGSTGVGQTLSFSDNKSNAYTNNASSPQSGASVESAQATAKNITGGSGHTFTMSSTGSDLLSFVAAEFSGRDTVNLVDGHGGATQTSATSHTNGSATTANAGSDVCTITGTDSAANETITAGSGWTIPTNGKNPNASLYWPSYLQYQVNVAAGTYTNTSTTGDSCGTAGLIIGLKSSGGGGGGVVQQMLMVLGVGS